MQKPNVGQSVFRKEGVDKVTGRARYVDDLTFPEMMHGVTVRSPIARGRLRGIRFGDGIPWHEFTIVTAKDVPGTNCVALILEDQPYLASEIINHAEEPILLLAHSNKFMLEKARRAITFDIEPLPAIFSIEDSIAQTETVWGKDNTFKTFLIEKGDVDAAWAQADFIVAGEYETGAQEQL